MSSTNTIKRRARLAVAAAGGLVAAAFSAGWMITTAYGEIGASTPTVQAQEIKAPWLAYAPPPAAPGVICLVDSGVDHNPDTETTLVGNHELYRETGPGDEVAALAPPVDGHPDGHGTLMAMLMAAPLNGWGMVGVAPQNRVYNMKALARGSINFHDEIEALAIETCARLQASQYPTMLTINLSLAGEATPEPAVSSEVQDAIAVAKQQGISVFAAAGNTGGPLAFPAAYSGAVSIGAADAAASPGTLCPFSARGAKLLAPGCDTQTGGIEGAWQDTGQPNVSQGTSQASAIASSIDQAIRDYGPLLTAQQAENCLTSTADNAEIDAAAAFTACGLEAIVREGTENEPKPQTPASDQTGSAGSNGQSTGSTITICPSGQCGASGQHNGLPHAETLERTCPRPKLSSASRRRQIIRISIRHVAGGCALQARIKPPNHRRWTLINHKAARSYLQFKAPAGWLIEIRLSSASGPISPSNWIQAHPY